LEEAKILLADMERQGRKNSTLNVYMQATYDAWKNWRGPSERDRAESTLAQMPQFLQDLSRQEIRKQRGLLSFERKEVIPFSIAAFLSLGGMRADDPFVVVPMLTLAGSAFIWGCVLHSGSRVARSAIAVAVSIWLGFIGIRSVTGQAQREVERKAIADAVADKLTPRPANVTPQERAQRLQLRIQTTELIQRGRVFESNMLRLGKRQIPNPRPVVASFVHEYFQWHLEVIEFTRTNFGEVEARRVQSPPVVIDFPKGLDGLQSFKDGKPGGFDLREAWTEVIGDLAALERFLEQRPEL
jgi:hypothetical protein